MEAAVTRSHVRGPAGPARKGALCHSPKEAVPILKRFYWDCSKKNKGDFLTFYSTVIKISYRDLYKTIHIYIVQDTIILGREVPLNSMVINSISLCFCTDVSIRR